MPELAEDYAAIRDGRALVWPERNVVRVAGPDATTYLQGQLSQDIEAIALGAGARSFLLEPTGKIHSWLRVTRLDDQEYLLDVDAGFGEAVVQRLQRFKLRTNVDVEPTVDWHVAVHPPGVQPRQYVLAHTGSRLVTYNLNGVIHFVTTGTELDVPFETVDNDAYDLWRIECGLPVLGREMISGETIPAEMGQWIIDASVSFTKGCYTGQELVARIDSRGGNVPRHLRGLLLTGDSGSVPSRGASVVLDGDERGTVSSAAWSPVREAPVALANLARAVEPGMTVQVRSGSESVEATVAQLPMLP